MERRGNGPLPPMGSFVLICIGVKSKAYVEKFRPGPASYNPRYDLVRIGTPGYSIGNEEKSLASKLLLQKGPGPEKYAYTKHNSTHSGHSFPTSKRGTRERVMETPGPGNYRIPCAFANMPNYATTGGETGSMKYV